MYVDLNMREHADTTAAKVFEGMGISRRRSALSARSSACGRSAKSRRSEQARPRHRRRLHRDRVRHRLANLFFLPVAAKLKVIVARQTQFREMVVDGMLCIAQGENPAQSKPNYKVTCIEPLTAFNRSPAQEARRAWQP